MCSSDLGTFLAHNVINGGTNLKPLIVGPNGGVLLAEMSVGSRGGKVMFGGMTVPSFHDPQPYGFNLRSSIHWYMTMTTCGDGFVSPGEQCDPSAGPGGAAFGTSCQSCQCRPGYTPNAPRSQGCLEINECTLYGFSGREGTADRCTNGVDSRTISCKPGHVAFGARGAQPTITLTGNTPFIGCFDINECLVFGYSGRNNHTFNCVNLVDRRNITCQAGYSTVKGSTVPMVSLVGNAVFQGCFEMDECALYGFSTAGGNVLRCEDRPNSRKIYCKPGYYIIGTDFATDVTLTANAAFIGCAEIDECSRYGFSGADANVAGCKDMVNAREITCLQSYFARGAVDSKPSIILLGQSRFSGCVTLDSCSIYGFSGNVANTLDCTTSTGSGQRTIRCLPGFYVRGEVKPSAVVTLPDMKPFTACVDIDECADYGYSGNAANTLSCTSELNTRLIVCKPGYTAQYPSDRIRLVGPNGFGGCTDIDECALYGYSGQPTANILSCVQGINVRTITCKDGYSVVGGTKIGQLSITLSGNTPFRGCADTNDCILYGFSGRGAYTRSCVQTSFNIRTITCMTGYYAIAPDVPSISINSTTEFRGCTPIDQCKTYGFSIILGTGGDSGIDPNVTKCINNLNSRTIFCKPGYIPRDYSYPTVQRWQTLAGNAKFNGCIELPLCRYFGSSNRPDYVLSCTTIGPNWRRVTCQPGYTAATHPPSDFGTTNNSVPLYRSYVDLYQSQTFYGCIPWCGDGMVVPQEACDDGNIVSGDGCDATCRRVEEGYWCSRKWGGMQCCTGWPDELWDYWPHSVSRGPTDDYYLDCYDGWLVRADNYYEDNSIVIDSSDGPWALGKNTKLCGNVILGHDQRVDITHDSEVRFEIESVGGLIFASEVWIAGSFTVLDSGVLRFADDGTLNIRGGDSCNEKLWPTPTELYGQEFSMRGNAMIAIENVAWTTGSDDSSTAPPTRIIVTSGCAYLDGVFYVQATAIPQGANDFVLIHTTVDYPCLSGPILREKAPFHNKDAILPGACSNIWAIVVERVDVVISFHYKDLCSGWIVAIVLCSLLAFILLAGLLYLLSGGGGGVSAEDYASL